MNTQVKRKPWIAVTLSVIFGAHIGMCYLNRGRYSLLYIGFTLLALITLEIANRIILPTSYAVILCEIILFISSIAGAIHCFHITKNQPAQKLKWFARWYSFLAIITL